MEAVRSFNNELSSLYEARPPVSRAKMANVTKCAIKAIKFYKHVVQSVEKFILKCKPEYKVPGLYVIDSIVRQSRHQFGQEKDVFAPRFTKNVVSTFQNLFKCPPDEKSKIVRVLNLWQMNGVFPTAVIQPLLDMAAETTTETLARAQQAVDAVVAAHTKHAHHSAEENKKANIPEPEEAIEPKETDDSELAAEPTAENILATQTDMLNTVTMLLQQTQQGGATSLTEQQAQLEQLQLLQQQLTLQTQLMQMPQQQTPLIDTNLLSQIQTLTNQLLNKTATSGLSEQKPPEPGFNKKLLDFDYGDSDEEDDRVGKEKNNLQGTVQNILSDSTLMQHIQQMSQNIQKSEPLRNEIDEEEKIRQKVLEQQQAEFDREINQAIAHQVPHVQPPMQQSLQQNIHEGSIQQAVNIPTDSQYREPSTNYSEPPPNFNEMPPNFNERSDFPSEIQYHNDLDVDMRDQQEQSSREHQDRDHRDNEERSSSRRKSHRSRDRSRSRSPRRRKRSRSRSRDRRRRSRSRDRRRRSRSRDRDRDRREKERERRRKGLPPIKDNCISVCTRTLWFGHLSKMTSEEELQNEIEKYGKVESINMIPPRGCAFVVMCRRKDGAKAVDRLKGVKINGSALKVAYAPGIGVKDAAYKDFWDVELGASYIPWENLPQDLDALVEGGMVDEDSLPAHLKGVQIGKSSEADIVNEESKPVTNEIAQQQQPQIGMPQGLQQQFRPPVPGSVPGMLPVVPQMMPHMMMAIPQGGVAPGQLGMPPVSLPPVSIPPVRPQNLVPISIAQAASSTPVVTPIQPTPPTIPTLSQQAPSVTTAANVSFPGQSISFPSQPLNSSSIGSLPQMSQTGPLHRPGFPHPPGFQNFNPSLPPPNFRMPPPAFNSPRPPLVRPPFENQTTSTTTTTTATEERSSSPNFDGSGNDDDDDEPSEVSQETQAVTTPSFPPPGPMNPSAVHPMTVMGMGPLRGPNPGPGLLPPPTAGVRPMLTDDSTDSPDNRPDGMNFRDQPNMIQMGMARQRGPVPQPGFNGFGGMDLRGFPPGMQRFPMRPGFDLRGRPRFPPNFPGGPPGPGFRGPPGMMMRPGFGDMRPMMDGPPPFGNMHRFPIRGLMDDAPEDIPEDFDLDLRGGKYSNKYDDFDEDQDERDKDDRDQDARDQDERVQDQHDEDHRNREHRSRDRDRGHRDRDHRDRDHRNRDHRDWNNRDRDRDHRDRDRDRDHRDRDHRDRDRDHRNNDQQDVDHRDRSDNENMFVPEQANDSFGDIDSRKSDVQPVGKDNSNVERRQRKKNRWTDNTDVVDQEPVINNENNNNASDNIGICEGEEPETNGDKIENLEQENPDILNPEVVDGGSTPTEAEPPTT